MARNEVYETVVAAPVLELICPQREVHNTREGKCSCVIVCYVLHGDGLALGGFHAQLNNGDVYSYLVTLIRRRPDI